MKSRAEALDTSLDALKTSFQSISQLSASLAPPPSSTTAPTTAAPRSPASPPSTPSRPRLDPLTESPASPSSRDGPDSTPTRRVRSASSATTVPSSAAPAEPTIEPFSPLTHLSALLSLPTLLRALLAPGAGGVAPAGGRARADALWGTWEPALRSWEDAGVEGAREVGMECREMLRAGGDAQGRRFSVSAVSQRG